MPPETASVDLQEHRARAAGGDGLHAPDGQLWGEQGLADRFVEMHGGSILYNHDRGVWLRYVGPHFEPDAKRKVRRAFKTLAKNILGYSIEFDRDRDALQKLANSVLRLRDAAQTCWRWPQVTPPLGCWSLNSTSMTSDSRYVTVWLISGPENCGRRLWMPGGLDA